MVSCMTFWKLLTASCSGSPFCLRHLHTTQAGHRGSARNQVSAMPAGTGHGARGSGQSTSARGARGAYEEHCSLRSSNALMILITEAMSRPTPGIGCPTMWLRSVSSSICTSPAQSLPHALRCSSIHLWMAGTADKLPWRGENKRENG